MPPPHAKRQRLHTPDLAIYKTSEIHCHSRATLLLHPGNGVLNRLIVLVKYVGISYKNSIVAENTTGLQENNLGALLWFLVMVTIGPTIHITYI